jgi:hypothetical protein
MVLGALLAFPSSAIGEQVRVTAYGPFAVTSRGHGQLSAPGYEIRAWSNGLIEARYAAPASHCSSVRVHFEVDGRERSISGWLKPGDDTGFVDLGPVTRGEHTVVLRAEGARGGCNLGRLISWGGRAWLRATLDGEAPAATAALGRLFFLSSYENWARGHVTSGCYVAADGAVRAYRYERGAPLPPLQPTADGLYDEEELAARLASDQPPLRQLAEDESKRLAGLEPLVRQASAAQVRLRRAAVDAGDRLLVAYLRVEERRAYRPVVLRQSGDLEGLNPSPAAQRLLKTMAAWPAPSGCAWQ